jgi:hypothetical protein
VTHSTHSSADAPFFGAAPIFGAIHLLTERLRACESTIYFERLLCEDFA